MRTVPCICGYSLSLFFMLFLPSISAAAEPAAGVSAGFQGIAVTREAAAGVPSASPGAPVPPPTIEDLAGDTLHGETSPAGELLRKIEPASILGLTLAEAYSSFGTPESVFSYRGEESWQDDVVFYYGVRLYLFWFNDRVWQVRLDSRFRGRFMNCSMGMKKDDVVTTLGKPVRDDGEWLLFSLPDYGFPVLARLRFTGESLSDAYVYRGDF